MSEPIPLRNLDAEIRSVRIGVNGPRLDWLFWVYQGNQHGMPFRPGGGQERGQNVWDHVSGSTIDDLTLAPSYWCRAPESHQLHCFIRNGHLELC